jgi:hypothetical protein
LDADWALRVLQKEDPTCFYLTEAVKDGAQARFNTAGLEHLHFVVAQAMPELISLHPRLRDALARASSTGSRINPVPRGSSS